MDIFVCKKFAPTDISEGANLFYRGILILITEYLLSCDFLDRAEF